MFSFPGFAQKLGCITSHTHVESMRDPGVASPSWGKFPPRFVEPLAVMVIAKVWFTAVAAVHQVVDGSGILHAQLSGHAWQPAVPNRLGQWRTCDSAGLTPFQQQLEIKTPPQTISIATSVLMVFISFLSCFEVIKVKICCISISLARPRNSDEANVRLVANNCTHGVCVFVAFVAPGVIDVVVVRYRSVIIAHVVAISAAKRSATPIVTIIKIRCVSCVVSSFHLVCAGQHRGNWAVLTRKFVA